MKLKPGDVCVLKDYTYTIMVFEKYDENHFLFPLLFSRDINPRYLYRYKEDEIVKIGRL